MRTVLHITLTLLMLSLLPGTGIAQEKEVLVDFDAQIEAARKLMRTERRLIHATELALTPEESKAFWPLYNEYAANIQEIGSRKLKLITDYAENFDHITDKFANQALDESIDIEMSLMKVRKEYIDRFKRIMPSVKVVRFYQVESKLDAVVNFQLAAQIPLMEPADAADD